MKNLSLIFGAIVLASSVASCIEFSAPMKWRQEAYLLKYSPVSERYFTEGMMDASVDMLKIGFSKNIDVTMFGRSVMWTGMGKQAEDVIFDPRDMHYSLVDGFRGRVNNYFITLNWYHDCFHEVDRMPETTFIWNIFELRFSPLTHLATERNEQIRKDSATNFRLRPKLDWEFAFGILPRLHSIFWFQYMHPFTDRIEADLRLTFAEYSFARMELRYQPTLWIEREGKTSQRQYVEVATSYYGSKGTMSCFLGYVINETQPIRPKDELTSFGFRWEY